MVPRKQGRALRGSQRWLQVLVNEHQHLISRGVAGSLELGEGQGVHWLSPVKEDDYAEYRDQDFLDRLGVSLPKVTLQSFWPRLGPVWDGLAKTDRGDVILVEAKSHITELVSDPTRAGPRSLARIRESLQAARRFYGSRSGPDWATCFYQYTNRLAHLCLLRELNGLPAYLLRLYFLNDEEMGGPATQLQWEGAIELLEAFLRIRHEKLHGVLTVFIDVKEMQPLVA